MPKSPTATEIAEVAGFDMSLIRESLALSHEERILQHQAVLDLSSAGVVHGSSLVTRDLDVLYA